MKMLLALLAWPTVAAACDAAAIATEYSWIFDTDGSDAKLATICGNVTEQEQQVDAIKSIVDSCIDSDTVKTSVKPIFDIIGDVLCSKGTNKAVENKEEFCLPSLAKILPLATIIGGAINGNLDLSLLDVETQLQKSSNLDIICRTNTCVQEIAQIATNAVEAAGINSPIVMKVILSAGAACVTDNDGENCALTNYKTDEGKPDATIACKDNQMVPCARKVLSVLGVGEDFSVADLCGEPPLDKQTVATAVLVLKNMAIEYFNSNNESVIAALKSDFGFNVPGMLPENIAEITINADDDTITFEIVFSGDPKFQAEIDINLALNTFANLLAARKGVAPHIDTIQGLTLHGIASQAMKLESIVDIQLVIPTDTTTGTTTTDNPSSAARLGASAAVVLLAAAMAM